MKLNLSYEGATITVYPKLTGTADPLVVLALLVDGDVLGTLDLSPDEADTLAGMLTDGAIRSRANALEDELERVTA